MLRAAITSWSAPGRVAARWITSVPADQAVWATAITLDSKTKALEVEYNTGEAFRYSAELLRVESPAAEALQRSGRPRLVHGRRHVNIMQVEPVGRYAVRLQFDDLHGTGLFTWGFLHELGRHKFGRMRRYIRALREQGLSRDPPRRKAPPRLQKPGGWGAAGAAAKEESAAAIGSSAAPPF